MIDKTWKPTEERFVGYIDIMGFKDIVARNTHEEVYKMMLAIDTGKKLAETVNWKGEDNLITTTTYSDSIMIYSKDGSPKAFDHFACSVATLTDRLFREQIPHKGAFAFGKMTLDMEKSIFFGQPLIDAYLLEQELNFYGIVGHASVEKELDGKTFSFIAKSLCYFKNGTSEHMTIFPIHTRTEDNSTFQKYTDELFDCVRKLRYKTSGSLRKYIDNTENYLKEVQNR